MVESNYPNGGVQIRIKAFIRQPIKWGYDLWNYHQQIVDYKGRAGLKYAPGLIKAYVWTTVLDFEGRLVRVSVHGWGISTVRDSFWGL